MDSAGPSRTPVATCFAHEIVNSAVREIHTVTGIEVAPFQLGQKELLARVHNAAF